MRIAILDTENRICENIVVGDTTFLNMRSTHYAAIDGDGPNKPYGFRNNDYDINNRSYPNINYEYIDPNNGDILLDQTLYDQYIQNQKDDRIKTLRNRYLKYQNEFMDVNLTNEMTKSESLVENGSLTETELPLYVENDVWLRTNFWGDPDAPTENSYQWQKTKIENDDTDYNLDPSIHGAPPRIYSEIRNERKSALGITVWRK